MVPYNQGKCSKGNRSREKRPREGQHRQASQGMWRYSSSRRYTMMAPDDSTVGSTPRSRRKIQKAEKSSFIFGFWGDHYM